jgi:dTDP-4-dehydrorhamnose reductase
LVFRGDSGRPYLEHDRVAPLNTCGLSLAEGERLILETLPAAMVVRTSACFGPWGESDFVARTLRAAAAGRPVPATTNVVSPTFLPDLMQASLDLLLDGAEGLWHLVNATPASWAELARLTLRRAGLPLRIVQEVTHDALGWRAPRPANSALATVHGIGLPPLEEALERCLRERPPEAVAGGPA